MMTTSVETKNMEQLHETSINKGRKWMTTGEPQPFKRRGRKESHDCFFCLGRKRYGITKADADLEKTLLEDYKTYTAIWNAYEDSEILLSPELAAALKAKISFLNL